MILTPERLSIQMPAQADTKKENGYIAYERVFRNAIGSQGALMWIRFTLQKPPYADLSAPNIFTGISPSMEIITDFQLDVVKEDLTRLGVL